MFIAKISSETQCYEVGKEDVAKIELTNHGSNTTTIYKIVDAANNLIVHAGLLSPHEVEYADKQEPYGQFTLFDF